MLVSIIMPYFKKKKYVKYSVLSVLNQTFKNFELIIVYDNKTSDELKFIFISSECHLEKILTDNPVIVVEKSNNEKCDRCWHRNESVGSIPEHKKLCSRCHQNVFDNGETRKLG